MSLRLRNLLAVRFPNLLNVNALLARLRKEQPASNEVDTGASCNNSYAIVRRLRAGYHWPHKVSSNLSVICVSREQR